ncbi:MAG TPA: hypothetical protein VJL90_12845, partial [Pseudorhodoplanes sp.]|nr:hypothetical protein [Pseudorhodoplanes sp.]
MAATGNAHRAAAILVSTCIGLALMCGADDGRSETNTASEAKVTVPDDVRYLFDLPWCRIW